MIAFAAYQRRRAWAAWHAGAPGKFKDVTFEKLAGTARPENRAMSADQMFANLRRFAVAHNSALRARAAENAEGANDVE